MELPWKQSTNHVLLLKRNIFEREKNTCAKWLFGWPLKKLASFSILWGAVWFIAGGPIQSSVLTFHYLRQTRHIIGRMEENYQTNNMNGWQKCKNLFCTLCVYFSPTTYVVVSNSVSPDSLSSNIFHPIEIEIPLIATQRRHLPREGKKSHVCGKKG